MVFSIYRCEQFSIPQASPNFSLSLRIVTKYLPEKQVFSTEKLA